MVRFETLASHETEYGANNFIEVARKVAKDETKPEDKGIEFISLSRGFKTTKGERRFRMHFTMPPDAELVAFVTDALGRVR